VHPQCPGADALHGDDVVGEHRLIGNRFARHAHRAHVDGLPFFRNDRIEEAAFAERAGDGAAGLVHVGLLDLAVDRAFPCADAPGEFVVTLFEERPRPERPAIHRIRPPGSIGPRRRPSLSTCMDNLNEE
jgi:hypothetical protein